MKKRIITYTGTARGLQEYLRRLVLEVAKEISVPKTSN